jgi:hypothetical protein
MERIRRREETEIIRRRAKTERIRRRVEMERIRKRAETERITRSKSKVAQKHWSKSTLRQRGNSSMVSYIQHRFHHS